MSHTARPILALIPILLLSLPGGLAAQEAEPVAVAREAEPGTASPAALVVGQAATLAVVLALVVAFFGSELASGLRELAATVRLSTPLLLAFAAWVVLTPVAGWIVLRQE